MNRVRSPRRRRCRRAQRREIALERLETRHLLAAIEVFAAGATGEERMELQIDGSTVQSWSNVGGDYNAPTFLTFAHNTPGPVSASQVRVAFVNDGASSQGTDKNLRVDRIVIDGASYESESPTVLSTGSYAVADGCAPGFKQSEALHCNGHFQYAATETIEILAAGATGEETLELQIDGATVATWTNVGGDFNAGVFQSLTYAPAVLPTADRVRVAFTNDGNSAGGADRNLRVDRIAIGGVEYQSEDASVLSTGTYTPDNGCGAGFKQSETLHCNGYLQYAAAGGSTIEIRAAGATGEESMELQIDGVSVKTWDNIGGDYASRIFQTFLYSATESISPGQVRIAFTNDGNSAAGADKNLRIDGVTIDGLVYESESPAVLSTGTYTAADGCAAGFKQSEQLHCGGYFEYRQPNGVIGLENSVITVNEGDGAAAVTILRQNGSAGLVTVDYRTVGISAVEDQDYGGVSGTAVFDPGVTSVTININIASDTATEGNEAFGFTIDNVTGGATLLAPRTATITIRDDDLPNYAAFAGDASLVVNGNASSAGPLQLAPAAAAQRGSAFYHQPLPVAADTSFQSNFAFQLSQGDEAAGADGFVFMLQNAPSGPAALSAADGGSLGYSGISNSLAVEFDSYQNAWDTNDNHVSILIDGDVAAPLSTATPAVDLNDGAVHYAWIDYDGAVDLLSVFVSPTPDKPASPIATAVVDLAGAVGAQAFLGFSAATGGLTNDHDILAWQLTTDVPAGSTSPPAANLLAETVVEGLNQPTAVDWTPDGATLYIAEKGGIVRSFTANGGLSPTPFIDISAQVNGTRDRGLLDIAAHPNFPATPYVYLLYTYDPPEVFNNLGHPLAGPDMIGNRAGRLTRVTADAANGFATAVPGSEVVLLGANSVWENFNAFANSTVDFDEPPAGILPDGSNLQDFVASDSESHTVGAVEFAPDGSLFVSIGDGSSFNQVDPRAVRVQDIDNLSGKVLRLDPLTGAGLPDNPFYNGDPDANRSKVYQYGFRNPFRISVDSLTGQLYVGDVGWTSWEEVNAGAPGDNFGWPYFEGGDETPLPTPGYQFLPEAQAFYASGAPTSTPLLGLNHATNGINAIVMGAVYTGAEYPAEYFGDLFFNDLGQGIVRNISLDGAGGLSGIETFANGAAIVIQIAQGPDGRLYYVDLDDGLVGRWSFSASGGGGGEPAGEGEGEPASFAAADRAASPLPPALGAPAAPQFASPTPAENAIFPAAGGDPPPLRSSLRAVDRQLQICLAPSFPGQTVAPQPVSDSAPDAEMDTWRLQTWWPPFDARSNSPGNASAPRSLNADRLESSGALNGSLGAPPPRAWRHWADAAFAEGAPRAWMAPLRSEDRAAAVVDELFQLDVSREFWVAD